MPSSANFTPVATAASTALVLPKLEVLNPTPDHPCNPSYGFTRKRPVTHLNSKARSGPATFRDLTDTPHQFLLNWTDISLATSKTLKRVYEQYRGGAFILIDHEGGGREYVGRFTTPVEPVPTRSLSWTVQYVQFDELPLIPMRRYPSDWGNDAVWYPPVDVLGNALVSTSNSFNIQQQPLAEFGIEAFSGGLPAGEFAQMQYVGYGFQLWGRTGPNLGVATVWLDGVQIGSLNLFSAADQRTSELISYPNVPFGTHRVKLVATGTGTGPFTNPAIAWDALKVMR